MDAEQAAGSPGQGTWGLRLPGRRWSWWENHRSTGDPPQQGPRLALGEWAPGDWVSARQGALRGQAAGQWGGQVAMVISSSVLSQCPLVTPRNLCKDPHKHLLHRQFIGNTQEPPMNADISHLKENMEIIGLRFLGTDLVDKDVEPRLELGPLEPVVPPGPQTSPPCLRLDSSFRKLVLDFQPKRINLRCLRSLVITATGRSSRRNPPGKGRGGSPQTLPSPKPGLSLTSCTVWRRPPLFSEPCFLSEKWGTFFRGPRVPARLLPAALFLSLSGFPPICTPRCSRKGCLLPGGARKA